MSELGQQQQQYLLVDSLDNSLLPLLRELHHQDILATHKQLLHMGLVLSQNQIMTGLKSRLFNILVTHMEFPQLNKGANHTQYRHKQSFVSYLDNLGNSLQVLSLELLHLNKGANRTQYRHKQPAGLRVLVK